LRRPKLRLLPLTAAALAALLGGKLALLGLGLLETGSARVAPAMASSTPAPKAAAPAPAPPPPPPPEPTPEQRAERAVLEQLRARRGELDARDQAVAERETLLAAAEKRLQQRIAELSTVQQRLDATSRTLSEREEQGWRQMVKLYEGMKPRDAATIFDELEMPVLLQILERMGERKAAPVLAAMRPERARLLTTELARERAKPAN
jgi:flagellar motility protein MotE (MotC chaperone)